MTAEGHQLIIQGDFNSEYEDLKPWMNDLRLADLIGKKHGKNPRNHTRSKDSPIDCIFDTANFRILRGDYLSFGRLDSDHRGLLDRHPIFHAIKL